MLMKQPRSSLLARNWAMMVAGTRFEFWFKDEWTKFDLDVSERRGHFRIPGL